MTIAISCILYIPCISQVKVYKHNPNSLKRKLNSECREKGKNTNKNNLKTK